MTRSYHLYRTDKIRATSRRILPFCAVLVVDAAAVVAVAAAAAAAAVAYGQDGGAKEPLGRIHEIFGPCVLPHYTVRVEGAAAEHQLVVRYQAAAKKLRQAEKVHPG